MNINRINKINKGLSFIVTAPTGGGKTTIVNNSIKILNKQNKIQINRLITYTTRNMRYNEINGIDYHFINHNEFIELQKKNYFFEVTSYNGNYYGSPQSAIDNLSNGISFIAITDRAGIISYKNNCNSVIPIWLTPPSVEILHERLINRGTENKEDLQKRIKLGTFEFEEEIRNPLCQYKIINNTIDQASNELVDIISTCLINANKI